MLGRTWISGMVMRSFAFTTKIRLIKSLHSADTFGLRGKTYWPARAHARHISAMRALPQNTGIARSGHELHGVDALCHAAWSERLRKCSARACSAAGRCRAPFITRCRIFKFTIFGSFALSLESSNCAGARVTTSTRSRHRGYAALLGGQRATNQQTQREVSSNAYVHSDASANSVCHHHCDDC